METKTIILLLTGLILLLGGGKYLVESSVIIARYFKIPSIIIGLTIVSFSTSAPELLVSLQAAIKGYPDMAVGNVVGSNISNILLVLGITALIFPLRVQRIIITRDWPIMMAISVVLVFLLADLQLSRFEGTILILLLALYLIFSVYRSRKPMVGEDIKEKTVATMPWWTAGLILIVASVGLAIGADLLVKNAAKLAQSMGISERVIAISLVAVGTSLPELATSIIAAIKKETDISIGNIIGSNIMNIVSVLGISSVITPIKTVKEMFVIDLPWMTGTALLLFLLMLPIKKGKISRTEGGILFLGYVIYIYFLYKS